MKAIQNPVLKLPAVVALAAALEQHPEIRDLFCAALGELQAEARVLAEKSWRRNKGPMAAYWKAVGVYAGHFRRAMRQAARLFTPVAKAA
jgi:hypothetical protein